MFLPWVPEVLFFFRKEREVKNGEAKNTGLWSPRLRISLACKFGKGYLAKPVFYSDVNVVPNSSPLAIECLILTVPIVQQPIKSNMKTTN